MTECTHTKPAGGCWIHSDFIANDGSTQQDSTWQPIWNKPTVVDINLHQYKCTQCGKVMNY